MADPLGELFVKIDADTKGLKTGLTSAEGQMGKFSAGIKKHSRAVGMAMTAMGAAIVASAVLSIRAWAKMGDEVAKMAKRTGFTTEALSELSHAAELSGASLAGIEKASRTLSGAITDAGFGLETYVRAFASLGLAYEDLAKLSPEQQLLAVLEALARLEDETLRAAIAADIMGRSGTAMLPMLADGAEGLKEMRLEAHELGKVFDMEASIAAENFTDTMTRLTAALDGVKFALAESLAPQIEPLIGGITEAIKSFIGWAEVNKELIMVITSLGMVSGMLMLALGPLLIAFPGLIAFAGSLSVAILPLLGLFGLLAVGLGMITAGLVMLGLQYFKNWQIEQTANAMSEERVKFLKGEENQLLETTKALIKQIEAIDNLNNAQQSWLFNAQNWVKAEEARQAAMKETEELMRLQSDAAIAQVKEMNKAELERWNIRRSFPGFQPRGAEEEQWQRLGFALSAAARAKAATSTATGIPGFQYGGVAGLHGPEIIRVGEEGPEIISPIGEGLPQIIIQGDVYGYDDFIAKVDEGLGEVYTQRQRMGG